MKKHKLFVIFIFLFLFVGIIFWQILKQGYFSAWTNKIIFFITCNDSDCNNTRAENNLVEVFYLPHGPIMPIREKIRNILHNFPEYTLREYNFENNANRQKINDYNLIGHIPVAIFINGINTFSIDGREVVFENFPQGDAFVPTLEGSWSYNDLEKVLNGFNQYKK